MTPVNSVMRRDVECEPVFAPRFIEDATSVRGPGWGIRECDRCDYETFGGYESVTEDAIYEHIYDAHQTCTFKGEVGVNVHYDTGRWTCPECGTEHQIEGLADLGEPDPDLARKP